VALIVLSEKRWTKQERKNQGCIVNAADEQRLEALCQEQRKQLAFFLTATKTV